MIARRGLLGAGVTLALLLLVLASGNGFVSAAQRKVPSAAERRSRKSADAPAAAATAAPAAAPAAARGSSSSGGKHSAAELQQALETEIYARREQNGDIIRKASTLMNKGDFAGAAKYYRKLQTLLPDDPNAVMDLMTCLERINAPDDAIDIAQEALKRSSARTEERRTSVARRERANVRDPIGDNVHVLNKLCRGMIYAGAESRSSKFSIGSQEQRVEFLNGTVVPLCTRAATLAPDDHTANYHIGHLLSVLHDFPQSVKYTAQALAVLDRGGSAVEGFDKRALAQVQHDYTFLLCQGLSSILDRLSEAGKCVRRMARRFAHQNLATPNDYYMLGAHISSVQRYSFEARVALLRSNQLWVQQNSASGTVERGDTCTTREFVPWWFEPSKWHTVIPLAWRADALSFELPAAEQVEGTLGFNGNSVGSWVPKHDLFYARYNNVTLSTPSDGNATQCVFYNDCFVVIGSHTLFARLSAQHPLLARHNAQWHVHVKCPVVALISPNLWNYYHWFAEGMSSLMLAREFSMNDIVSYMRDRDLRDSDGSACRVKYLVPSKQVLKKFAFEALKLLEIDEQDIVHYEPMLGKYYTFEHVFVSGWKHADYDYRTNEDPSAYFAAYKDVPLPSGPGYDPMTGVPKDGALARAFLTGRDPAQADRIAEELDGDAVTKAREDKQSKVLARLLREKKESADPEGLIYDVATQQMPRVDGTYDNDLWSLYFPPKELMRMTRSVFVRAALDALDIAERSPESGYDAATRLAPGGIIYCSRGSDTHVRRVHDEQLLIDALREKYGNHTVTIWKGTGVDLPNQIMTFRRASIVVSPHGAAQTNMLWMRPGTSVVEFHVRNNAGIFSHMGLAMGLEFWDLSEINAAYFKDFRMNPTRVSLVLNVVDHIMRARKLTLPEAPVVAAADAGGDRAKKGDKKKSKAKSAKDEL